MAKSQIAVRVPSSLLAELNNYVEETGISKTEVVVSALAEYLGHTDSVPLNKRVAELEEKFASLETQVKGICRG